MLKPVDFKLSLWLMLFLLGLGGMAYSQATAVVPPSNLKPGLQALFAGDYPKAEAAAMGHLKVNRRSPEALVLLARVQMAQGKYQPAYASLRKALASSPSNVEALYFMGKLTSALSQMEYQRLEQLAPNSARLHQLMGDDFQAAGDSGKAEAEYKTALSIDPERLDVAAELGEILRTRGRFEDALKYYEQVLEKDPRHFTSLFGVGMCYQALQHNEKVIEFFARAAQVEPGDAQVWVVLGNAWLTAEKPDKAAAALKEASRLEPNLRQAHTLLGRALQQLGQTEQAAQELEKARQLMDKELLQQREKTRKIIGKPEEK